MSSNTNTHSDTFPLIHARKNTDGLSKPLSCDGNGNFFRLDMNAFQPERHYRVLYRVVSGSGATRTDQFIDNDFIFKVSR